MLFYIIHNIVHNLPFTKNWRDSQKNILTLFLGANLYIILFVLFEYFFKKTSNIIFELIRKFYLYFIFVDIFIMAIVYKKYWGRSIWNEVTDDDDKWKLNEENHKYTKINEQSEIREFVEKTKDLENIKENINNLENETANLKNKADELENKTDELETALLYHPDGDLAQGFKTDFETHASQQIGQN